jgi:hypothetical protein
MYKMRGEVALLAAVGATIVEMSMVLEVMVAHNEGITVLMLSLVTNMVIGVFLNMGMIEKAIMESMDEGRSAEIILLLRPSAGMGNDNKLDVGEGEIVLGSHLWNGPTARGRMRDRVGDRWDGEDITTVLFYISMREELNAEV